MKLLQNECMKLFKKKGTWVMGTLLVLFVIGTSALFTVILEPAPQSVDMQEAEAAYAEAEGLAYAGEEHILVPVIENAALMSIVTMFTVIAAATITAGEHAKGTIKLLLIRPVSRWQILLSKLGAVVLFGLVMTGLLFASSFVSGMLFYGWNLPEGYVVQTAMDGMTAHGVYSYIAAMYSLWFVDLLLFTAIAFMIGTVFKSSALGIGVSLVLLFTGSTAAMLIADYSIANVFLFSHTDLASRFMGFPGVVDVSLAVSGLVMALYGAAFLAVSFWRFTVQDVLD
ncbi:ABC transporter permease [Bacillus daqingensis]|uniref:ABC transporter permease n=1 Tax=Bacillus daqingensis TaxID=872396 RepID=A0ABV9NT46_9BACI